MLDLREPLDKSGSPKSSGSSQIPSQIHPLVTYEWVNPTVISCNSVTILRKKKKKKQIVVILRINKAQK